MHSSGIRSPCALARIAAAVPLAVSACAVPGRDLPYASVRAFSVEGRVATNLDLLASGRTIVDSYLAQLPEPQRERITSTIDFGKRASARIVARYGFGALGTSYVQNAGSGVFVAGSDGSALVLTAGHTFTVDATDLRVKVFSMPGLEIAATRLDSANEPAGAPGLDFALMQCEGSAASDLVLAQRADPREGELVVALGYPDQCGVDREGRVVRGESYWSDWLEPLALILEVVSEEPLVLLPVAGALPLGGFSGGGIFDLDGNVVGVLTGNEWEPSRDSLTVRVRGCSVAAIRAATQRGSSR